MACQAKRILLLSVNWLFNTYVTICGALNSYITICDEKLLLKY